MDIGLSISVRNARLEAVRAKIDGGLTAGTLSLYKGIRPATAAPPGEPDLLAVVVLGVPCATVDAGVITFIFGDALPAVESGTPSWGRFSDGDGNPVLDGSVGETELIQVDTETIYAGGTVTGVSATLTEGNP